jgi:predicted transcriptional regulator
MATTKKKPASKKPAQKPRSMPAKVAKPKAKAEATQAVSEPATSKKAQILALMERPEGATIDEMMKLTNWQTHTVRGFLSLLKKSGKTLTSERTNDERRYRIGEVADKAEASA